MSVVNATDRTFAEEVLQSETPVLVDFWAPWCGPCRMMAPVLDQYAERNGGRVKVVKLNADENPEVSMQYQIRSIPTMMLFRGGRVVQQIVGFKPKAELEQLVNSAL